MPPAPPRRTSSSTCLQPSRSTRRSPPPCRAPPCTTRSRRTRTPGCSPSWPPSAAASTWPAPRRCAPRSGPGPSRSTSSTPTPSSAATTSPRPRPSACGVFVVDSLPETLKVAEAAPGSQVLCRLVTSGKGSDWPLSRKYGCSSRRDRRDPHRRDELGLDAAGLCFHVGSQQRDPEAWAEPIAAAGRVFTLLRSSGLDPRILDLGGGFRRSTTRAARRSRRTARPSSGTSTSPSATTAPRRSSNRDAASSVTPARSWPPSSAVVHRAGALGVPGRRRVHRPGRDAGRGDPLPAAHLGRRRSDRAVRAGRPDV